MSFNISRVVSLYLFASFHRPMVRKQKQGRSKLVLSQEEEPEPDPGKHCACDVYSFLVPLVIWFCLLRCASRVAWRTVSVMICRSVNHHCNCFRFLFLKVILGRLNISSQRETLVRAKKRSETVQPQ